MSLLTPERRLSGTLLQQRRYSRVLDVPVVHHTSRGPTVRVDDVVCPSESDGAQEGLYHGQSLSPEARRFGNLLAQATVAVIVSTGLAFHFTGYSGLLSLFHLFGFALTYTGMFVACCGLFVWWRAQSQENCDLGATKTVTLYGLCTCLDVAAQLFTRYSSVVDIPVLPSQVTYFVLLGTSLLVAVAMVAHKKGIGAVFAREPLSFVGLVVALHVSTSCLFHRILPAVLLPQLVYVSAFAGLTLCDAKHLFVLLSFGGLQKQLQPPKDRLSVGSTNLKYVNTPGRKISVTSVSIDGDSSAQSLRPGRHSFSSTGSMLQDVDITEANGLIGDLLLNEDLSDGMEQKLRKVRELLAPRVASHTSYTPRMNVTNPIAEDRHDHEHDVVTDTTPAAAPRHQHAPRRSGSGGARRTSHFSTTTTSSGMPVLHMEPSDRCRSLALRDVRARISVQESSVHKMREKLVRDQEGPRTPSSAAATTNFFASNKAEGSTKVDKDQVVAEGAEVPKNQSPTCVIVAGDEATPTKEDTQSTQLNKPARSVVPLSPLALATHSTREQSLPIGTENRDEAQELEQTDEDTKVNLEKAKVLHSASAVVVLDKVPNIPESIEERGESPTPRGRSFTIPRNMRLNPFSGELERLERNKAHLSPTGEQATPHSPPEKTAAPIKEYQSLVIFSKYKPPDYGYQIEEYSSHNIALLDEVSSWDFPIFELKEIAGDHILSHMAYCIFNEAGLMETFKIPQRKFINYFRALEAYYGNNVYHNKVHAADVLHATSYLLFEIIPEFSCTVSSSERIWTGNQRNRLGGNIASAFSILEVFATYMAAAVHDFDHPGRTNAFLVATKSPLAILYNDRAVLENHHAAASWDLLTAVPEHNFLGDMEEAELKRFRFLLVEAVLATDLKMHFDLLSDFKAKVDPEEGGSIDWSSEVDRLMVMKMIMKMADISTPTKSFKLHRAWTKLITEEFFQQGEQEVALGLPPTIFLDRNHPEKLPAVQLSFIQNLVSPLFHACAEAGVIPGFIEDTDTPPLSSPHPDAPKTEGEVPHSATSFEMRTDSKNNDLDRVTAGSPVAIMDEEGISVAIPAKKFVSVILTNLQVNYEGWQAEIPPPEEPLQPEMPSVVVSPTVVASPTENSREVRDTAESKSSVGVSSAVEHSVEVDKAQSAT